MTTVNIMADKQLEFYFFYSSFYSQKGWTAMEEKCVPYKKHIVMLGKGEGSEPWYMRINPNGTVPALKHGERLITDSQDIIYYLEDTFPNQGSCLVPRTDTSPEFRERVIRAQQRLDTIRIDMLTFGSMANPHLTKNSEIPRFLQKKLTANAGDKFAGEAVIQKFQAYAEANPDLRDAYEAIIQRTRERGASDGLGGGLPSHVVEKHLEETRQVLQEMEDVRKQQVEAGNDWLCGPDYSMADLILGVTMKRFTMCGYAYLWQDGKMPHIEELYEQKIRKRRSFKAVSEAGMGPRIMLQYIFGHKAKYIEFGVAISVLAGASYFLYSNKNVSNALCSWWNSRA